MKSAECAGGGHGQVVLGIAVIAFGILFLLHNLDIIHIGEALSFWPTVLIVAGVIKLADARALEGRLIGGALLFAGVLLMLNRVGLLDFSWQVIWPMILIAVGGSVVVKALAGRYQKSGVAASPGEADDSFINATAILGAFQRRLTTPTFAGGEITAIMGDCKIDLRDCSLQGEVVVNVFAVMGGITLKCPADWTVILYGTPLMGGFEEKTIRPPDGSKRLVVKGYAIMGAVDVRN